MERRLTNVKSEVKPLIGIHVLLNMRENILQTSLTIAEIVIKPFFFFGIHVLLNIREFIQEWSLTNLKNVAKTLIGIHILLTTREFIMETNLKIVKNVRNPVSEPKASLHIKMLTGEKFYIPNTRWKTFFRTIHFRKPHRIHATKWH